MKAWAALGAFLSLVAGGQPPTDSATRRPENPAGYSVEGGDFYVWEEDQKEAERWAIELAQSRPHVRD